MNDSSLFPLVIVSIVSLRFGLLNGCKKNICFFLPSPHFIIILCGANDLTDLELTGNGLIENVKMVYPTLPGFI